MAEIDLSKYLTSFEVFGKTSDTDVSDALKELIYSSNTNPEYSQDDIASFIESSRPIDKSEIGVSDPMGLLTKSMVINNVVSKPISLPDQKIITESNFNVAEVEPYFDQPKSTASQDSLSQLKSFKQPKPLLTKSVRNSFFDDLADGFKETKKNIAFNVEENQAEFEDTQYLNRATPEAVYSLQATATDWLKQTIEETEKWGNTFRFNFTVYHNGTSIEDKPTYAKYDPVGISKIALKYISKFRGYNRGKKGYYYTNGKESYFEKNALDFKVSGLATRVSLPASADYQNKERTRNNPFITDLLNSGPDLNQNMFDVYLRFNTSPSVSFSKETVATTAAPNNPTNYLYFTPIMSCDAKGKSEQATTFVQDSTFENVYSFSVRTASVDIPLINRETTSQPFLNTQVERPGNTVTFNNNGTLSVDCDANTYVLEMFLALSGLQRDGKYRVGFLTEQDSIQSERFDRLTGHYPFMAPAKLGFTMNTVDLVVSSHALGMFTDKRVNPGAGATGSNVLYVFEDVRFLGTSSAISFNSENASSQSIDVPFIFKRLETYYKPDNTPFAVVDGIIRNSRFNKPNLKGVYYDETSITDKLDLKF